jgi:hypothetical protein
MIDLNHTSAIQDDELSNCVNRCRALSNSYINHCVRYGSELSEHQAKN